LGAVAALAAASGRFYDELAEIFAFDFVRSGLVEIFETEGEAAGADQRLAATLAAGFSVEKVSGSELRSLEPGLGFAATALYYAQDGQLNPVKLGAALIDHLRSRKVRLCPGTDVTALRPSLETGRGRLDAETVIVAAGSWTPQLTRTLGWMPPIRPMRGTLVAVEPLPPTLRHTIVASRYYFWQLAEGHVAGGGSVDDLGFTRGVDPATETDIRREIDRLVPAAAGQPTVCAWSGFRPYCTDLKPVIGAVPGQEKMFVAAGHFKKGVMLAPVTGKVLADLVTKGCTELPIEPLLPERFPLSSS
jgi:glycine oxidase